ncbi:hypothetical protein [Rhodococcoides yunnanense]|uniref:hypothetical protein n=1 Tax=Rhodococcoides yunnanense TaxID=278209 RepID=UPI000933A87F|nr:hypothetical protein [Rhodococcus yunnanensis]
MNGVDQGRLRRLASELSVRDGELGHQVSTALDRCFTRIRVQVTGRVGVGKSTVRAVLDHHEELTGPDVETTESAAVDVPRSPDPILDGDVLIHVLAGGVQAADVDVIAAASCPVVVLAKADTVDDVPGAVERLTEAVGVPVLPLTGTIARTVLGGRPVTFAGLRDGLVAIAESALLTPERFELADSSLSRQDRHDLVDAIEMLGVRTVVEALREDPARNDVFLRRRLAEVSGLAPMMDAVRSSIDGVRVDRAGRLAHRLTELAVQFPAVSERLEEYLASDEAVLVIMRSALRTTNVAEPVGSPVDAALEWHRRACSAVDPSHRRAFFAVSRGYLRMRA